MVRSILIAIVAAVVVLVVVARLNPKQQSSLNTTVNTNVGVAGSLALDSVQYGLTQAQSALANARDGGRADAGKK
jgi:hypothetical protein